MNKYVYANVIHKIYEWKNVNILKLLNNRMLLA